MEKGDKGSTLTRMCVSWWMFLLVPAYLGCPGQTAVKCCCCCCCCVFNQNWCSVLWHWCASAARNVQLPTETSVVFHCLAAAAAAGNVGADFSTAFCAHTVDYSRMAPAYMLLSWWPTDISACVFKSRVGFHVHIVSLLLIKTINICFWLTNMFCLLYTSPSPRD